MVKYPTVILILGLVWVECCEGMGPGHSKPSPGEHDHTHPPPPPHHPHPEGPGETTDAPNVDQSNNQTGTANFTSEVQVNQGRTHGRSV